MHALLILLMLLTACIASAETLTPDDAVRAALANDPALTSRIGDVDAALGVQRENLLLRRNPDVVVSTSTDGDKREGSIIQPLSLSGEGFNASRSARAGVDVAVAAAERARFETAANTRRAYARAVLEREKLRFAEEDRALLARLRGVAERRVAAGEGIDLDLRLARLEQARATAAWLNAQAEASAADVELATLIARMPGDLARDPLVAIPAEPGDASPRSDLAAAQAATRAAHAALARERSAILPEIGIGMFYEKDAGRELYGPVVTAQLPLWHWNQSGIGAARGNLRLAKAKEASTAARVATEEARAAERLQVAEESLATLPSDLAAEAVPALRTIERLFASGQASLSDTLLLRSRVVEGERAWMEARAAVAGARIDVALTRQSKILLP